MGAARLLQIALRQYPAAWVVVPVILFYATVSELLQSSSTIA